MLLDCVSLVLAIRCKSEMATRQLLARLANETTDQYAKTIVMKSLPFLSPQERDWLKSW